MHYLDGRDLYGEADFAELPLPDQLHPDAATHRRIGERFTDPAFGTAGPFGASAPFGASWPFAAGRARDAAFGDRPRELRPGPQLRSAMSPLSSATPSGVMVCCTLLKVRRVVISPAVRSTEVC